MKTKTQIASTILLLALVTGCFATMPLTSTAEEFSGPISGNKNQNFVGTTVNVDNPTTAHVNEEVKITITIDRTTPESKQVTGSGGMPDVSILVNDETIMFYSNIKKNTGIETHSYTVDTSQPDTKNFDVSVIVHTGSNHEHAIYAKTVTIEIIENQPTVNETFDDILSTLQTELTTQSFEDIVFFENNAAKILLTGKYGEYLFVGGNSVNGGMNLKIDDYTYTINKQGNSGKCTVSVKLFGNTVFSKTF